jgi:hypothetical protein
MLTTSFASAQTGSLSTWENIADGTLTSTWVENETVDWKPQNDSGVWEYNCSVTADVSFTFNETVNADRWFDTFEVVSDDSEAGVGSVMVNNLTSYYAIVYYYVSTDHGPGGPQCHLMCYDTDHFDYWNGTGFENNASNASDLDNDWEKEYSAGDFYRVKVMWDFHSTIGCSLHFKLWNPSGDEYPEWMVDLEFPNHPSITTTTFKSGLFVDSRYDLDASETDFRRIFFWDTAYDMYVPILPTVNEYIACPTINCFDVYGMYNDYADLDPDDIYNQSQLFKEYVNLWDLQVIYSEEFFDGALLPYNQNDSVYHFSLMFTDTRAFYEQMFGPGLPDDFPDNMLMTKTFLPIDGSSNDSDFMVLRIDTDNNDVYDSYDYAIWSNDTDLILYHGWTPFVNPFFADMWGGPVGYDGEFGNIFRDKAYYEWDVYINWDMIYNGSSGERIGDDLCRMSIGWYDQDTALTSEMVFMQDYDPTDDANPYPATDGMDFADDPVFFDFNDSQNWLYFQVDASISGEPLADPEDPVTYQHDYGETTNRLVYDVLPIVLALALIVLLFAMIFSGAGSIEEWIKLLVIIVIIVIVIQVILSL